MEKEDFAELGVASNAAEEHVPQCAALVADQMELAALRDAHADLVARFGALVAERDYLRIQHAEDEAALHAARVKAEQALSAHSAAQLQKDRVSIHLAQCEAELAALREGHLNVTHRFSAIVAERDFLKTEIANRDGAADATAEHYRRATERLRLLERERVDALAAVEARLGLKVAKGDAGAAVDVLIPTRAGRELSITVPTAPFARTPSPYFFSYAKAGSVLLDALVRDIAVAANMPSFNLSEQLFANGHAPTDIEVNWQTLFAPHGVVHFGFRNYPPYRLPVRDENPLVLLVRDPRDMLVSGFFSAAQSHALPEEGPHRSELERARAEASQQTVDEFCLARANDYLAAFEYNRANGLDRAIVFRYEDIIFKKHRFVADLCGIMGAKLRLDQIDQIAKTHDIVPVREVATAHIRNVTPGDHRNKLRPETIERLNVLFEDFMAYYGYAVEAAEAVPVAVRA